MKISIIKALKEYIGTCHGMELVSLESAKNNVNTDAIYPKGNINTKIDVCGNKTYFRSYAFLAKQAQGEISTNQQMYDFLEDFCDLVEETNDNRTFPSLGSNITVISMEVSDITLMNIADGWDRGTYMVQINLSYIKGE